jgi:hypothetical protein
MTHVLSPHVYFMLYCPGAVNTQEVRFKYAPLPLPVNNSTQMAQQVSTKPALTTRHQARLQAAAAAAQGPGAGEAGQYAGVAIPQEAPTRLLNAYIRVSSTQCVCYTSTLPCIILWHWSCALWAVWMFHYCTSRDQQNSHRLCQGVSSFPPCTIQGKAHHLELTEPYLLT